MIERIVRTHLLDDDDIRNVVGQRVFANYLPIDSKGPAILLRRVSSNREQTHAGEPAVVESIVQVDSYERTASYCWELFELIRNRLNGYSGDVTWLGTGGSQITTTIGHAWILRENALTDSPRDASDRWVERISADFTISHSQTVPTHT